MILMTFIFTYGTDNSFICTKRIQADIIFRLFGMFNAKRIVNFIILVFIAKDFFKRIYKKLRFE